MPDRLATMGWSVDVMRCIAFLRTAVAGSSPVAGSEVSWVPPRDCLHTAWIGDESLPSPIP